MPSTIRTFVAVEVDEAVRRRAVELIDQLRAAGPGMKWVAPQNMHFTLKFLGDVREGDIPKVCEAVQKSVADLAPFELAIRGLGAFPRLDRASNLWLGTGEGADRLGEVAERIEKALRKLGFPREKRPFSAHLTLARVPRGGRAEGALVERIHEKIDFDAGRSPVREVVLFSSLLRPTGSIYTPLCRGRLVGE